MSKGSDHRNGTPRVPRRKGIYKRCSGWHGCGGRGYLRGKNGEQLWHGRCGGDGEIRVGTAGTGRGRAPRGRRRWGPKRRGSWRQRRRKAWKRTKRNAAVGGGLAAGAYVLGGTVGLVVVGVLLALVLVLAIGTRVRTIGGAR